MSNHRVNPGIVTNANQSISDKCIICLDYFERPVLEADSECLSKDLHAAEELEDEGEGPKRSIYGLFCYSEGFESHFVCGVDVKQVHEILT